MKYCMTLDQLLGDSGVTLGQQNVAAIRIDDLTIDSRAVKPGSLFCAYPGTHSDGRKYIANAVEAGAVAVLCEAADSQAIECDVPLITIVGLRAKVGLIANVFFDQPSTELQVFGVTGTNGKTTCCYLLTQAFSAMGMDAVMLGTLGSGRLNEISYKGLTTPDPVEVHRLLAQWRDQGVTQVAMEVSSHGLHQGRVAGVQFYCSLFTNLSHDHLDYHGDMQSYALAKRALFTEFPSELVVTNADDEFGASLIDVANSGFVASYSVNEDAADVCLLDAKLHSDGMQLCIEAGDATLNLSTPLIGEVNIPNLLLLVTTLLALSVEVTQIEEIVANLSPAPGRMEVYVMHQGPRVVVDFAHTPDALDKALASVQKHCTGQLWCVFGCGGDRDRGKRPIMGAAAQRYADHIIVTNDNPRSEHPQAIADDIVAGIEGSAEVILDRASAIRAAIGKAKVGDWVLLAGRGHETLQQIGAEYLPFSDREFVTKIVGGVA